MKKYLVAALLFTCFFDLYSQDNENPLKEFWKKEKIKINVEEALKIINSPEYQANKRLLDKRTNNDVLQADKSIFNDNQSNIPESEIHSAINPTDPLNVVVSPIRQNRLDPTASITCPIYYTKDGGKTWSLSSFQTSPPAKDFMLAGGGDPVFAFDANGVLFMSWIHLYLTLRNVGEPNNPNFTPDSLMVGLFYAKSTDGGASWNYTGSSIESIQKSKYTQNQNPSWDFMLDKQWMATDLSNSQYRNSVYMSAVKISFKTGKYQMVLYRKEPNSDEFLTTPTLINTAGFASVQFGNVDVDNDGNVHYTFMGTNSSNQFFLYHCISEDGGATFSNPVKITEFTGSMRQSNGFQLIDGISESRLYPSPYMAVDKSNGKNSGNIYITWTANGITSNVGAGHDVYFSFSEDQGKTWSNPSVVNDNFPNDNTHSFYSNIAVNDSGVVAVTFYDRRSDLVNNVQTDYYIAFSFDGGNTFDKNIKLTSSPSNFLYIGNQNNGFGIGEYNGVVMTDKFAYPFWADGRTNNGEILIYTAEVPIEKNAGAVNSLNPINNKIKIDNISPIPANSKLLIDFTLESELELSYDIIDLKGNIIKSLENSYFKTGVNSFEINLFDIITGTYLLRINSKVGYLIKKFTVKK